jgi:hypothetical protein
MTSLVTFARNLAKYLPEQKCFKQVVQRVKIIINPVAIVSIVVLEIINSTKCVTTFTVCAHFIILMCGTPFVLVEYTVKEIRPVNVQILLLQL